jgi:hypothetical protein
MDAHDHPVIPPSKFARMFPLAVAVPILVGTVVAMAVSSADWRVWLVGLPALLVMLAAFAGLARAIAHPHLRLRDGVLECGRMPRVRVPAAALDLDAARVIELDRERELRPVFRLFGTSLPGFHAGWFRLRDKARAFLLVTDRHRVLLLPRREAGPLLLSAERPEALLEALRRARG